MKAIDTNSTFTINSRKGETVIMKKFKAIQTFILFILIPSVLLITGCGSSGGGTTSTTLPMVTATLHASGATGVPINTKVVATFSESMDNTTATSSFTFVNTSSGVAVPGTLTYSADGLNWIFTPTGNLQSTTQYTATITTGAKDLFGNALANNFVWSWTTGTTAAVAAPLVTYTDPVTVVAPGVPTTNVPLNKKISAAFSEGMDPSTITTSTFTLKQGATNVSGSVAIVGLVATFTPTSNLSPSTTYTATITTGAKNLAGIPLAASYIWSFTTGASADTTAPQVVYTNPLNGTTTVLVSQAITASFSEGMDPLTVTTANFTVTSSNGTPVVGTVLLGATTNIATFTPTSPLLAGTTYTATIKTGAKDLNGNPLAANYSWTFTTYALPPPPPTPPTVVSVSPADLATNVSLNSTVAATFSKEMAPSTINTVNFTVTGPGLTPVTGTIILGPVTNTATFTPTSPLLASTTYTATIKTAVTDLAGNALATQKMWSFTTGTGVAAGPLPVNLGLAGTFAILAETGISTTGTTAVVGNMGISPAAASFITGFGLILDLPTGEFSTSSLVTGKVYAANYVGTAAYTGVTPAMLTTAIGNMTTAYTTAAGLTVPAPQACPGSGNFGGLTLTPGLYKCSTGVLITSDMYLSGGADDVWVFQIAQSLDLSSATTIHLTGGAQAKNVFWQIAGTPGATLETGSNFSGIILSKTEVIMKSGAILNGRALAQTQVTLIGNHVTAPANQP